MVEFSKIVERWYETKQHLKLSTLSTYYQMCFTSIVPFFKDKEVTNEEIQRYVLYLTHEKNSSQKTVQDYMILLGSILKWGAKEGLCKEVILDIDYPTVLKFRKKKSSFLNVRESRKLRKYLVNNLYPDSYISRQRLVILIALDTGMRVGEIIGLKFEDIDYINQQIQIRRTAGRISKTNQNSRCMFYVRTPKTRASKRLVFPSNDVLNRIREMERFVKENNITGDYADFIFHSKRNPNKMMSARGLNIVLKKILIELKLPHLSIHKLRHSFASTCLASNIDVKTASSLLGHSSPKMTLGIYTHTSLEQKKKAIKQLDKIFQ